MCRGLAEEETCGEGGEEVDEVDAAVETDGGHDADGDRGGVLCGRRKGGVEDGVSSAAEDGGAEALDGVGC